VFFSHPPVTAQHAASEEHKKFGFWRETKSGKIHLDISSTLFPFYTVKKSKIWPRFSPGVFLSCCLSVYLSVSNFT